MNRLTRLIVALSVDRPLVVLAVLGPVLVLAAVGLMRIDYEDGLRALFATESAEFQAYSRHARGFAQSETDIAVLVTAADGLDGPALARLQDFVLDVQFLGGVQAVYSAFSLRHPTDDGTLAPVLPDDLTDADAVRAGLQRATRQSPAGISMVSSDLRETLVVLSLARATSEFGGTAGIVRNIRDLAGQTARQDGLDFAVTGLLPVRERIVQGLRLDQMRINLIGAVLGFAVALLMFRSLWVACLNTVTPLVALLFCLGGFGWLGLTINALTNVLPVLILVLASSDSIHITYDIRRRMADGQAPRDAIADAVIDIAPPCVLTSLTTILAFLSLSYSDSPIIRNLAYSGAAGVLIALLVVLVVHPLVYALACRFTPVLRAMPEPASRRRHFFSGRMILGATARFRIVALGGIALCIAALLVLLPIRTDYRFMENIEPTFPVARSLVRVEAFAGPVTAINLPLRLVGDHAFADPEVLADLSRIHGALENLPDVRAVVSVRNLLPLSVAQTGESTAEALSRTLDTLPGRFRELLIGDDARSLQIMLLVPDRGSRRVARLVRAIDAALVQLRLDAVRTGEPTGFLVMSGALSDRMIRQLTVSFLFAALACPLLIGLWYRRFDFGLAATIPNILPIALVGAGLTVMGTGIQFTSALALTIAFGIALDDSIHVFNRLHLQAGRARTVPRGSEVRRAMMQVSPVLITTTLILSSGILATQASEMPTIRFFGILCIATFFLALLCDLILLPALVTWISGTRGASR